MRTAIPAQVTLDRSRDRATDDVQIAAAESARVTRARTPTLPASIGRVVLAQILLVIGERALAREVRCDRVDVDRQGEFT